MNVIHEFMIEPSSCSTETFSALRGLAPPGRGLRGSLSCGFNEQDPKLHTFMTILRDAGLNPRLEPWRKLADKEYVYNIRREYTHSDYMQCDYLHIVSCGQSPWVGWLSENKHTLILKHGGRPWSARDASFADTGLPLCSSRLRANIEQQGLRGVQFRPCELRRNPSDPDGGRVISWSEVNDEPWWQITSEVTLPPLSPVMTLLDVQGKPQRVRGVWPWEGAYELAELHYRAADLAALVPITPGDCGVKMTTPFDAALTFEHIRGLYEHQQLIVSRAFYELSKELCLPWEFVPVRVDP